MNSFCFGDSHFNRIVLAFFSALFWLSFKLSLTALEIFLTNKL